MMPLSVRSSSLLDRVQSRVYALFFLVIGAIVAYLLTQINLPIGLLVFVLTLVSLPAIVIHRREARVAPDIAPDAESQLHGVRRLLTVVGLDATGVALAVLLIVLCLLVAHKMG